MFLNQFAGFTYCNGFPFGNDGGAELLFIFILAIIAMLVLPFPKIIQNSQVSKKRFVVAKIIGTISIAALFKSALSRKDFHNTCNTDSIQYFEALMSSIHLYMFAVLYGIFIGISIRTVIWVIHMLIFAYKNRG